jgi:hypothetical protein
MRTIRSDHLVATALRRAELLRSDGLHVPSTGPPGYQAWAALRGWNCSRVLFYRRASGAPVAFAFGERRCSEVVSSQEDRLSDKPRVALEPRAQVTDLAMAGIQIDREGRSRR